MSERDDAAWMRAHFDRALRDIPETVPRLAVIQARGRRRKARIASVGAAAGVCVVATAVGATALVGSGGDGGGAVAVMPSPFPTATAPVSPPSGATSPGGASASAPGDVEVTVAKGQFKGHQWELVVARGMSTWATSPPRPPGSTPVPCETHTLFLDGVRSGGTNYCAGRVWPLPDGELQGSPMTVHAGGSRTDGSGPGELGTVTSSQIAPEVARVVAKFPDGTTLEATIATVTGPGDRMYVLPVPVDFGHGDNVDLALYDASGKELATTPDVPIYAEK